VPSDEILKAQYQKSLDDARELSQLAGDLQAEFEKASAGGDGDHVISLATLKKSAEAEKVAKRINGRLKTCW